MVMSTLIGLGVGAALSAGTTAIKGGSFGDILKSAGIGAATGAVTGGAGSAIASSATGALGNLATTAGSKLAESSFSLLSNIGKGLTTAGGKMIQVGAEHGIKASIEGLKNSFGAGAATGTTPAPTGGATPPSTTTGTPLPNTTTGAPLPGNPTNVGVQGTGSNITNAGSNMANAGVKGTLPDLKAIGQQMSAKATGKTVTAGTKAGTQVASNTTKVALKGKIAPLPGTNTATVATKSSVGETAKKIAGQVGVQGLLAIGTTVAGAAQAQDANEASRQGLLLQQKTYDEQRAARSQLKNDAFSAYQSASAFGETLFGENSQGNLLTSYTSASDSNYSIFKSGVTTRKSSDLT